MESPDHGPRGTGQDPLEVIRCLVLGQGCHARALAVPDRLQSPAERPGTPVVLVIAGFWIGVMVGFFMSQVRRPDDPSTLFFDHLQAVSAVLCMGGLVWLAVQGTPPADLSPWTQPGLAAMCTYYTGVR